MRLLCLTPYSTCVLVLMAVAVVSPVAPLGASPQADPPAVVQGAGAISPADQESAAVQAFERRITEYVELHRLLEGPLPRLQTSNDMSTVRAAMAALTKEIRLVRRNARQGDFFTQDVSRVMRRRIATCLPPEQMEAILAEGEPGTPTVIPVLRANMEWPEDVPFTFVPPQLIAALPPLPPELQYRIIGRALVLWDHHANLIVDFVPAAFTT